MMASGEDDLRSPLILAVAFPARIIITNQDDRTNPSFATGILGGGLHPTYKKEWLFPNPFAYSGQSGNHHEHTISFWWPTNSKKN